MFLIVFKSIDSSSWEWCCFPSPPLDWAAFPSPLLGGVVCFLLLSLWCCFSSSLPCRSLSGEGRQHDQKGGGDQAPRSDRELHEGPPVNCGELQETLVSSRSRGKEAVDQWRRPSSDQASVGIHRGVSTAGSTACQQRNQSNHVDAMGTDGGSHPAAERATSATRDDGNNSPSRESDDLASQDQSATSTITQKQAGVVDTRVIGRPDEFDGDPMKYADWLSKLRAHFGAVDQRFQLGSKTTEASSIPCLDAKLSCEASCLRTQMYYTLVMTTTGSASDKCHSAGMNEGFEARKQFVMELEMEFVGLLMNVPPTKLAAFERLVHQSWGWRTCGSKRTSSRTAQGSRAGHRCERKSSRSREHNSTMTANLCQFRAKAKTKTKVRLRKAKATAANLCPVCV